MRMTRVGIALRDPVYSMKLAETLSRFGGGFRFQVLDGSAEAFRQDGKLDLILTDLDRSSWPEASGFPEGAMLILLTDRPDPEKEDELSYYEDARRILVRLRFLSAAGRGGPLPLSGREASLRLTMFTTGSMGKACTALALGAAGRLAARAPGSVLYLNLRLLDSSRLLLGSPEGGGDLLRFLYRLQRGHPLPLDACLTQARGVDMIRSRTLRNPLSESLTEELMTHFLDQLQAYGHYRHLFLDVGPELSIGHLRLLRRCDQAVHLLGISGSGAGFQKVCSEGEEKGFEEAAADLVCDHIDGRCQMVCRGKGGEKEEHLAWPGAFPRALIEELTDRLEQGIPVVEEVGHPLE